MDAEINTDFLLPYQIRNIQGIVSSHLNLTILTPKCPKILQQQLKEIINYMEFRLDIKLRQKCNLGRLKEENNSRNTMVHLR